MKTVIFALSLLVSASAFSITMGPEAQEIFAVMSHPQVQECMKDVPTNLVNVKIEKTVARCFGCNTYTISGNELAIDVPRPGKTVISIVGRAIRPAFGGLVQSYECSVKN